MYRGMVSVMTLFFTKEHLRTLAEQVSPWEELVTSDLSGRVKLLLTGDIFAGRDDHDVRGRNSAGMLTKRKWEKRRGRTIDTCTCT